MADKPAPFNRKSAELVGRTVKEFRGRGRGEAPPPKRPRHVMAPGGGTVSLKFAITQLTGGETVIPAATGSYLSGNIAPGKNINNNLVLFDFGAAYGDPAIRGSGGKAENYMFTPIANHKPVFVLERSPGIYAIVSEGCAAVPA